MYTLDREYFLLVRINPHSLKSKLEASQKFVKTDIFEIQINPQPTVLLYKHNTKYEINLQIIWK